MYAAFPRSDSYEDPVTIGLASRRRSRVSLVLNVTSATEVPHSSPRMNSLFIVW
jgi:hypothetical protein